VLRRLIDLASGRATPDRGIPQHIDPAGASRSRAPDDALEVRIHASLPPMANWGDVEPLLEECRNGSTRPHVLGAKLATKCRLTEPIESAPLAGNAG